MSIPSLRPCIYDTTALLVCNYRVIGEDEAKRRNSGAKTKTFEEYSYLLPYTVSSKEDMAYQRQLITRIRVTTKSELCILKEVFPIEALTNVDSKIKISDMYKMVVGTWPGGMGCASYPNTLYP
ncbi:hypothetical protein Tco_0983653 [Tanacetum coccineum]